MIALNLHRRAFERGIDRQAFQNFYGNSVEEIRAFMKFRKNDQHLDEEQFMEHAGNPVDTRLYDVLGVSTSATPEEIKLAYKKIAMENHP